jgi:superfamily II DNA or RNA helicase
MTSFEKLNTYLGQKGYTLVKNELTIEQQKQIRNDLTIKPSNHGMPGLTNQTSFPAYRESLKKMYVPHYYGVENFGPPKEIKISNGESINLEFKGNLRENQEIVVKTYLDHVSKNPVGGGLFELPCAYGKTVIAINVIAKLNKKTFIIVHKEFLMNQWIERIAQFLPKARIGKIQGQIIDIDNKDIVIGMLQSLSMKEYPASIFDTFGLTIIDEVHHISSEVFSNSLFKLVTKYMLGLSATMERKDGTTKVFKMFLGEVVFKGKRDEEHDVIVRAIEYKVNDEEFNETKLDFRGKPAYSSMISKLCEYNRRSEFILKILCDMLLENSRQQIMILAHNKNLLKYLHDAIVHKNITTVGYYVGGMKETALKETESKQIVIATYAMAAEALDIKTLTTLIMATPKTDIEQSVGRILRDKHANPMVVDIIDSHDLFKNQWRKRKTFYKRENYKIIYTTSMTYSLDFSKWETVYEPKNNKNHADKNKTTAKKTSSSKSNSSNDKSITNDSDSEVEYDIDLDEDKDKPFEKCLLKFKK